VIFVVPLLVESRNWKALRSRARRRLPGRHPDRARDAAQWLHARQVEAIIARQATREARLALPTT
jgi:dephospho-CoA kinase